MMKTLMQILRRDYFFWGTFFCFWLMLEMMRIPLAGSAIATIMRQPIGSYSILTVLLWLFSTIADALILSIPAIVIVKRKWIVFCWIAVFAIYALIQTWYIQVYLDVMPFSHFLLVNNVNGVLVDSVLSLLSVRDIFMFIPLFVFMALHFRLKRKSNEVGLCTKKRLLFWDLFISLVIYVGVTTINCISNYPENSIFRQFTTPYNNGSFIQENGFVPFVGYSIVKIAPYNSVSEEDIAQVEAFVDQSPRYDSNLYNSSEKKNVIFILVESMNSWYLQRTECGVEIMPFLNRCISGDSTVSALKVMPQVKDGRSSDGSFIYNTGLLPIPSGSVSISYERNSYPSIAKALKSKGYQSLYMICDSPENWNQKGLVEMCGFDKMYDRESLYRKGKVLSDEELFTNALSVLKKTQQPFFAQLVTISTHRPGIKPEHPTALSEIPIESVELKYALEGFHLLDSLLERFIEGLKDARLYDNSIIIASDHDEIPQNVIEQRDTVMPEDRNIAFIALNTPQHLVYEENIGQIDIYPTILDIIGCSEYPWKGLGRSILRSPGPDCAVHWNKTFVGNVNSRFKQRCEDAWNVSNTIIKTDYFKGKSNDD